MLFLFLFLTVTLSIYGLISIKSEKKDVVQDRLDFFLNRQENFEREKDEKLQSMYDRILKPLFFDFKKSFKKRMPGEKEVKIERKLQLAGNPHGMTPVDFRLLQTALFCILPLLFGGYGALLNKGNGLIVSLIFMGFLVGFFLPHQYLKNKTKARSRLALREFPDTLDLLTVSLEAGLGFDAALTKIASRKEGVLSYEFNRCLEEIRLGKTRREALSGIRDRLDVDVIKAFISSVLQAEKLGIGMVRVLRVQSNEVREQRKQRAEEAAMKAPIKMLFPLILFIFPSLFIVLLGPAVLQMIEMFQNS
jgi:tight adherence protein C